MSHRFLHVLESFAPGGMETTFLNMLGAFRGIDPTIEQHVLSFAGGALEPRFREVAARVTVACDTETLDAVVGSGYDLVHFLFERCAYRMLPRLVARHAVPVVYGKGYDMAGMYRLNEGLMWQPDASMLAAADGVTFTTEALARGYSLASMQGMVLGKAADIAAFDRLAPPDATTPCRILSVANLHPRKRLGDLIAVMPDILAREPKAELRLVGGGDALERSRLLDQVSALELEAHVSLAGHVADVSVELAAARVLALSSSCEGVPTAVLEAMAAARPVVSTRVGHIETIVDDGVEGFLVDVGDRAALADRIARVLGDPGQARIMGDAARRRASRHSVDVIARRLLALLSAVAFEEAPSAHRPLGSPPAIGMAGRAGRR
jgi:glycosyltransferase involved in cell wall biosynthesis